MMRAGAAVWGFGLTASGAAAYALALVPFAWPIDPRWFALPVVLAGALTLLRSLLGAVAAAQPAP